MTRNVLYATLEKKGIPIKFDEARKVHVVDKEPDDAQKSFNIIVGNQKSNLDRNSILEQLKLKNILVTSCKVPHTKKKEEEVKEIEEEVETNIKEAIILDEETELKK